VLLIGEDNLENFPKWKNYERILEFYEVYVYPRLGTVPSDLLHHRKVSLLPAPWLDLSATFIRDCIKRGKSIRYLVPEAVERYIAIKKLYL
jgi:nicotinate-nucleotide adenylyltransferase